MEVNAEELIEELTSLTKYYGLTDILDENMVKEAVEWLMARSMWRTFRHMVRSFLIDYYREHFLAIDNPSVGNGLGRWHIQIVDDPKRKIYCGQKMCWDSSFHENLDVQKLIAPPKDKHTLRYSTNSICEKCIIGYLRKYRRLN